MRPPYFCFYVCAPTSKRLLLLVCAYIQVFAFSLVYMHQNGCFHSCALTSTCLPLLVCAYIVFCVHLCTPSPKVWIFSCAPTYECLPVPFCACIKCLLFSRVRPHQNVCFHSCASASKYLLFLHRNGCMSLCTRTSKC